jgi:hypothetical protein
MAEHLCSTCKHAWWHAAGETFRQCKRFPPTLPPSVTGAPNNYPTVSIHNWCGEWGQHQPEPSAPIVHQQV